MGLSPASSLILRYMFIITPRGIYSQHSCVFLVPHVPRVHLAHCACNSWAQQHKKLQTTDLRLYPLELILNHLPRHNTNEQIPPQSHQPTHTVPQPRASYTRGLQLCLEDSSLPLNRATLILRTCRLAAFHFMQLCLKALLSSSKLKSPKSKHFDPSACWSSCDSHSTVNVQRRAGHVLSPPTTLLLQTQPLNC